MTPRRLNIKIFLNAIEYHIFSGTLICSTIYRIRRLYFYLQTKIFQSNIYFWSRYCFYKLSYPVHIRYYRSIGRVCLRLGVRYLVDDDVYWGQRILFLIQYRTLCRVWWVPPPVTRVLGDNFPSSPPHLSRRSSFTLLQTFMEELSSTVGILIYLLWIIMTVLVWLGNKVHTVPPLRF